MRKLLGLLLVVFVFVAVSGFAADKRLNDRQMDSITAGQPFPVSASGVVVLGDSRARITKSETVTADNTAGTDLTALNFILSSGSFVGTGLNIWYGTDSADAPDWVRQTNSIFQNLGGGAYLEDYDPGVDVHLGELVLIAADLADEGELDLDLLGLRIEDLGVRFGGEIEDAGGEFIVADDSRLSYTSTNSATIDNGAMTGLSAINAIVAANSLVATGVNLAITSQDLTSLNALVQRNTIVQRF